MKIANNILETIGNTPLVRLNKIVKDIEATVLAKVEFFNPGSSVKDRMALKMVEDAEKFAAADKEKSSEVAMKNQADMLCYQLEKKAGVANLTDELKEKVQTSVASCREILQGSDFTNLSSEYEKLQQVYAEVLGQVKS